MGRVICPQDSYSHGDEAGVETVPTWHKEKGWPPPESSVLMRRPVSDCCLLGTRGRVSWLRFP